MTGPFGLRRRTIGGTITVILATSLMILSLGCHSEPDPPRRVYLVTIDTLRADHLGCYGYARPITPFLDRLAAEGALFERTVASSSTTMASHTSLFTSLQPPQHRLRNNGEPLHESVFTMAQMFREQGYETAAFTTVDFTRSLERGFDHFDTEKKFFPAEHVLDKASRWLVQKREAPRIFVWIHLFDVHEWYRPKHLNPRFHGAAAERTTISPDALARFLLERQGIAAEQFGGRDQLFDAIGAYDDQIVAVDTALETFAEVLERNQMDDDALWIVTADHGEGVGSHNFNGHGGRIYNEQLRVPLILRFPDGRYGGRRISELVRHVDVLPTLAELVGASLDDQVFPVVGTSLTPLLESDTDNPPVRAAFSERRSADERRLKEGWEPGEVFSLQTGNLKVIFHSEGEDELYDLRNDPLELTNLASDPSEEGRRLRATLILLYQKMSKQGDQLGDAAILPENIEELKALGYL